ncbi:MAG TPA: YbjN domain-containing protein [Acidimicrobiales bacterium]|nr:YbjN domain-containing protein [Acidimicrobiales bacterium]
MPVDRATAVELKRLRRLIDGWAQRALDDNPLLAAVDRDPALDRWYVRLRGEEKQVVTLWLTLRELTLQFETYFMPAPEEEPARCYEYLLRANARMFGWRFAIGAEDAVYLVGQLPLSSVDEEELDRVVGSGLAYSDRYFVPAMRIGYASRFPR